MTNRLALHDLLTTILESGNVYFQPPSTVSMRYPCIVYSRNEIMTDSANDKTYRVSKRYQITVIDKNPDSTILDKVMNLPRCSFVRHFTKDNLNHDVYNLYY